MYEPQNEKLFLEPAQDKYSDQSAHLQSLDSLLSALWIAKDPKFLLVYSILV